MASLISVTHLSSYLFCKRKLYLEQVLGLRAPPLEASIMGTIRHHVLDLVSKQEKGIVLSIVPENVAQIEEKYQSFYARNLISTITIHAELMTRQGLQENKVFDQLWLWFREDAQMRARNLSQFIAKTNLFGRELWDNLSPKIHSELYVDSHLLELKGKIDRVEERIIAEKGSKEQETSSGAHKTYIPVEIKTGRAPREGVWESHLIQIAAYILLLEEYFACPVNEGKVQYLDALDARDSSTTAPETNDPLNHANLAATASTVHLEERQGAPQTLRTVRMNPYLREEVIVLKEKVKWLLQSKELPNFVDNENKCRKCPLQRECWEMGGRKV